MLNPTTAAAIQAQVGIELFASSSYAQFASCAYSLGLVATSEWLRKNASEEREHADGFLHYLDQRGVMARIPAVDAPAVVTDPAAMAATLLALEERVTAALQAIHDGAEGDGQTCALILQYLAEQTDGEDAARRFGRFVAMSGDLATLDQQVKLGLG
jgi:ferritin